MERRPSHPMYNSPQAPPPKTDGSKTDGLKKDAIIPNGALIPTPDGQYTRLTSGISDAADAASGRLDGTRFTIINPQPTRGATKPPAPRGRGPGF